MHLCTIRWDVVRGPSFQGSVVNWQFWRASGTKYLSESFYCSAQKYASATTNHASYSQQVLAKEPLRFYHHISVVLDLGRASYNKMYHLECNECNFPRPPALFCRVEMVLCMLRNSQPSHTTICYHAVCWKVFITHFCNQIPLIRQKFVLITFILADCESCKLQQGKQQNPFYILLSYRFRIQGLTLKWALWCCSRHDNNTPTPHPSDLL